MAEMYLVTLSDALGNDIELQRWMLDQMCNRAEYLGQPTCTTINSTWQEQSDLISKLVRLYEATDGDYWKLKDLLDAQIKEAEAGRSEEEVKQADQNFKTESSFFRRRSSH